MAATASTPARFAAGAAQKQAQSRAEALAARLPALILRAERIAAAAAAGVHGRRRAGPGDEFWQYRDLRPGDAARLVDWRRSARGDRLYVREREWAAPQTALLWVDPSPSMDYAGDAARETKGDCALILALALAALLLRGGERVGWLGGAPPGLGRGALGRLATELLRSERPMEPVVGLAPPRARLALFSDFIPDAEAWALILRAAAARGIRGAALRVLDPVERDFPFTGRLRFEGLEGEAPRETEEAGGLAEAYRRRLGESALVLDAACRGAGWRWLQHATDAAPVQALAALSEALS